MTYKNAVTSMMNAIAAFNCISELCQLIGMNKECDSPIFTAKQSHICVNAFTRFELPLTAADKLWNALRRAVNCYASKNWLRPIRVIRESWIVTTADFQLNACNAFRQTRNVRNSNQNFGFVYLFIYYTSKLIFVQRKFHAELQWADGLQFAVSVWHL